MSRYLFPVFAMLQACGSSRVAPPASPNGMWTVSISVDRSSRNGQSIGRTITGRIRLESKTASVTSEPVGRFGYYGTCAIDFRPIGGWLSGTADTTPVVTVCGTDRSSSVAAGSAGWDDSVHVTLNPCTDHGKVVLDGAWRGDHVAGRWYETTEGGSSGTFAMRRAPS